jgi:hypothetical protein
VPAIEASSDIRRLSYQAVAAVDPARRAEALRQIREQIRDEYRFAATPEQKCSLRIAESIFDFIEETTRSR